jgi:hypothetical protein
MRLEAQAEGTKLAGEAEPYREGVQAMGREGYVALQVAGTLGEHHVKVVPDIAVGGEGGGLAQALVGTMLRTQLAPKPERLAPNGHVRG